MNLPIPRLPPDPYAPFPPAESALRDPEGLLAFGGDLRPDRLLNAYRHGIFPWYARGQPILWWSPDPRMVFSTSGVHLSSRFRRALRHCPWVLRADTAFDDVIAACARIRRPGQRGTWITREMAAAYRELHRLGHAHSLEVWDRERLVGGIYGVAVGQMFFGESMFSAESGGSKVALAGLAWVLRDWGWPLIDAQLSNQHLVFLGGIELPRAAFLAELERLCALPGRPGLWSATTSPRPVSGLAA